MTIIGKIRHLSQSHFHNHKLRMDWTGIEILFLLIWEVLIFIFIIIIIIIIQ